MNFIRFPAASTNIFPIANSTTGGQLLTEFNLRSRESVSTPAQIKYMVGHSFAHSMQDFEIDIARDEVGNVSSTYTIKIFPGRAVVNGHYIESLVPVLVNLAEANMEAQRKKQLPLRGQLEIGLRVMYSTEATMAYSMLKENSEMYMEGIQVVILPKGEMKLPVDVPSEQGKVNAHLKLGEFAFINGAISENSITQNKDKCKYLDASRLSNVDDLLDDTYITKTGLNPKKFYTMAGKAPDTATKSGSWVDTWCDSTDALMTWDLSPKLTTKKPTENEASFGYDANGNTLLRLPHKQMDGMTDTHGVAQYYESKTLNLPKADYLMETPGTVDKNYTRNIKYIQEALNNFYHMKSGKQRGFIEILNSLDELPVLNQKWEVGDYILVGQDNVLGAEMYITETATRPPSSMYVVLPGLVTKAEYVSTNKKGTPDNLSGIEISRITNGSDIPETSDSAVYNEFLGLPSTSFRGKVNEDYFTVAVTNDDGNISGYYYYKVSQAESKVYSMAVMLTGSIPLATEDVVGGFLNVPTDAVDGGYVLRDDTGHLRLLDYDLLRTGVLAYQLGEDITIPAGLTVEEIQNQLDEYVNSRVAFPNEQQIIKTSENSGVPNCINITIELPEETEDETEREINIYDIDSRFSTSIYIHILGTVTANTTINISNCEKVRIDNNITGNPKINLINSCLYYDSSVLDSLTTISGLKLWYEKFSKEDANLLVDDMTVIETDAPIIPEDMDFWSEEVPNDNHFMYALRSLTFADDGTIIKCGIYIKNETTTNVDEGKSIIVSDFTIPQGSGLTYPVTCLTKPLKITGTFVTAYSVESPAGYMTITTNFTAVTQPYSIYSNEPNAKGTISFLTDAALIQNVLGIEKGVSIDSWESNSYQVFEGNAIG